ncbi:probable methyltransferase TARBP1 [Bombina bombina]|uniref:probable methyltransferase TARBP1 n=1 Tax=Bombina bombina TaxID=8345 RepID=UPI00235AEF80|nr:probable methyltransferase TARBP1 [Bombina bombina]
MEQALADSLLSHCKDHAALINELSSCMSASATQSLEITRLLLGRLANSGDYQEPLISAVTHLAIKRCLPLLSTLRDHNNLLRMPGELTRVIRAVCGLLRHCAEIGGQGVAAAISHAALASLELHWPRARWEGHRVERSAGADPVNNGLIAVNDNLIESSAELYVEDAVEVLGAVVPALLRSDSEGSAAKVDQVVEAAVSVLREGTDEAANLVCGRLLPCLGEHNRTLKLLWVHIMEPKSSTEICLSRRLLVLSTLADHLFSLSAADLPTDSWCTNSFWRTVRDGLSWSDSLARKRAVYLLKRAVDVCHGRGQQLSCVTEKNGNGEPALFFWSAQENETLLQFWETFILVVETLEGNQVHVIKPVLPKVNFLFETALSENKDCWVINPSWHLCIYKRMFESENKNLAKEGILHFFEMYSEPCLPRSEAFSEFIIGPLMDALSESSMFSRSPGQLSGECPLLGTKFQTFLATFVTSLSEETRGEFLLQFIKKMTSRHWCSIPILFISKALANIPTSKAWGVEGLHLLREVVQCTMATHQIFIRGAAQCFLLQAAMNLVDVERVSFADVSSFLMCLKSEESLCRGSMLWKELCSWLYKNDNSFKKPSSEFMEKDGRSSLNLYVYSLIDSYLKVPASKGGNELMPDWFESKLVSTMILLAADIELMRKTDTDIAEHDELRTFLSPLLDTLSKLSTNAYMPTLKTDKSLQLLLKLLQTCSSQSSSDDADGLLAFLWNLVLTTATSILDFILRRIGGELKTISDVDRCDLYLALVSEFVRLTLRFGWKQPTLIWKFIYNIIKVAIQTLLDRNNKQAPELDDQIQKVVSMASLASVCEILSSCQEYQLDAHEYTNMLIKYLSSVSLNNTLIKPSINEQSSLEETTSSRGWGKIVARYLHDQWVCLHYVLYQCHCLQTSDTDTPEPLLFQTPAAALQLALDALSILPSDQAVPIFHCMKLLVPKVMNSSQDLCTESINMAWNIISSLCSTQFVFWPNLKAFVEFVFSNEVLSVAASTKGEVYQRIKEIIHQIVDMANSKTGVFNILISYCCESWTNRSKTSVTKDSLLNANNYIDIIIEACIFGTVFRRDQRIIQDTHAFIESLGQDCAANVAVKSINKDEHYVRVCAVKFLCLLDGSNSDHKEFLQDVTVKLLDKDVLVSKSKARYYGNSLQHRVKNRLWQTLLLLIPKLDQNFLSEIIERIFQAGFGNNQASVKYLMEWLIILILHTYPEFLPKFWDCFSNTEEKLKTSICTFLSVLPHFDVVIEKVPEKVPVLKKALVTVLQWCFNHNFSVRLYALIALKKLWSMCKQQYIEEFEALSPVIESSLHQVETIQGVGNAKKNWIRIQDHFFFSTFHALKDYSIETIFYTLPSLSELIEDEWIPSYKFSNYVNISGNSSVPLSNSRSMICNLKTSDWLQQDLDSGEADHQPGWLDIQKKIIPWKNSIPDLDLEMVLQYRASKLGKSNGSLIVVASLIDKPTNLGGLCRTSEIFGVSALVVDSLHHVNDKQFQYLSVTAEQWLPLIEVKPRQLLEYLQLKKTEGYTIIGVEQTAKSSDLAEYSFPEKSLLLLGNEREGIPANLIQHLDVCVEIPQQGIIRSLNVHVSGAVLIWEYTRQHITKQKDGK